MITIIANITVNFAHNHGTIFTQTEEIEEMKNKSNSKMTRLIKRDNNIIYNNINTTVNEISTEFHGLIKDLIQYMITAQI